MEVMSPAAAVAAAGGDVRIRPWQRGDLERLVASEALYSAETCSRRFLVGQRGLPSYYLAWLRRMESAPAGWAADVAIVRNRLVAVAECAWDPAGSEPPELAVMVADAWQRLGLGRRTLGGLIRRCREAGVHLFGAEYLDSNPIARTLAGSVAGELGPDWTIRVAPGAGTHRMVIAFGPG